jgi:hypothetical protein
MADNDEDLDMIGDLMQRTGDGQTHVRYLVAGQLGGQVMPCAVCTVHKEKRSACFLVVPQNQGRRVFQFGPQNRQLRFDDLDLKITARFLGLGLKIKLAMVCRLCHKNDRRRTTRDTR